MDEQTTGQQQSVGEGQTVGRTQGSGLDEGGGLGQAPTRPMETPDVPAPSGSSARQADRSIRKDGGDTAGPAGPAGVDPDRDRRQDPRVTDDSGHVAQAETPAERNLSGDDDSDTDSEAAGQQEREDTRASAEEFAAEHDPEKHDTAAGEEFRQRGDWTAEDTGGPQVWDAEGTLVEGSGPGSAQVDASSSGPAEHGDGGQDDHNDREHDDHAHGHGHDDRHQGSGERRTSTVEEIRDGGYGVGSAAPLDDGAMPFGHPVKAWHDTQTFVDTDHPRYDDAEPHVWFTDPEAAGSAGFRRAGD